MPRLVEIFLSISARRRRRVNQNYRRQLVSTVALISGLLSAHVLVIMALEDLSLGDAVWLTLTTVTTVGYGDITAETATGRAATVVLLYFGAVLVFARVASAVVELRVDRRERQLKGSWRWGLRDHIVIVGTPQRGHTLYLERLLTHLMADDAYRGVPVQLLSDDYPDGLPSSLTDLGLLHYHATPEAPGALDAVNVKQARHIILLAREPTEARSDITNVDLVHRIREMRVGATIVVEVVDDTNRDRFRRYGVSNVVRPTRTYPELLVRSMVAPGSEEVVEELLSGTGSVIRRYDVRISGWLWRDLAQTVIGSGHGTPLGYIDRAGAVMSNPLPDDMVDGYGVIVLARAGQDAHRATLLAVLRAGPSLAVG